eukprot:TRINITY_DN6956_c0_g2_i1.p1 TRINITY_DN6956_c0_g2~~TRINITY_DN6956_c0_g2_i1.p1  ORF type:complete len:2009 (+),score=324.79 TRINITY_DN6956_c0_g2_i1:72-6098(+)
MDVLSTPVSDLQLFWIPNEKDVWSPCERQVSFDPKVAVFKTPDCHEITLPVEKVATLAAVNKDELLGVEDICTLSSVSYGAMLHTVRERYARQEIHTRVSRILIAVNPFEKLPIYSSQVHDQYATSADSILLPPHIFGLGQDAIIGVKVNRRNQAILISGESGAGKTESAKLLISYVTEVGSRGESGIERKIVQTSPIFEAFGNATTVRNNNSSRFGKWIDMRFTSNLAIETCLLAQYLLETTRVCKQEQGDRNYHIFFQLFRIGKDTAGFPDFQMGSPQDYRYLRGGLTNVPGINDDEGLADTIQALDDLGITKEVQVQLFGVVKGILTLGNVDFVAGDSDAPLRLANDAEPARRAAEFLGVNLDELISCMIYKTRSVGGEEMKSPLSDEQAQAARDTLVRVIYGRIFEWLVVLMNESLLQSKSENDELRSIGVLDIAGFECFKHNAMEQLCINLSNEHLQQFFNKTVFKRELQAYYDEGIDIKDFKFTDNCDVLELIDGKRGIFDLLDESNALPKSTPKSYTDNLVKVHGKHPRFITPKFGGKAAFGVKHFAGEVIYTCDRFLDTNVVRLPDGAARILGESSVSVVRDVGKELADVATSRKPKSSSATFRASLRSLLTNISSADCNFVRCAKPNVEKVPGRFTSTLVMEQLVNSGVFEAIRIRHEGLPVRVVFQTFVERFMPVAKKLTGRRGSLTSKTSNWNDGSDKDQAARVVTVLQRALGNAVPEKEMLLGKTKVFCSNSVSLVLEAHRSEALKSLSVLVQAAARGRLARNRTVSLILLQTEVSKLLRSIGCEQQANATWKYPSTCVSARVASESQGMAQLVRLLESSSATGLENGTVSALRHMHGLLEQELATLAEIKELRDSCEPVRIEMCLAKARTLVLPEDDEVAKLVERGRRLRIQLPLVTGMRHLLDNEPCQDPVVFRTKLLGEADVLLDVENDAAEFCADEDDIHRQAVVDDVVLAGLDKEPGGWVDGLDGERMFVALSKVVEARRAAIKSLNDDRRKALDDLYALRVSTDEVAFEPVFERCSELNVRSKVISEMLIRHGKLKVQVPFMESLAEVLELFPETESDAIWTALLSDPLTKERMLEAIDKAKAVINALSNCNIGASRESWLQELNAGADRFERLAGVCKDTQDTLEKLAVKQQEVLGDLNALRSSIDANKLQEALDEAHKLKLSDASGIVVQLTDRLSKLRVQMPLSETMRNALDAGQPLDALSEVAEAVRAAGLHERPDLWVTELEGSSLYASLRAEIEKHTSTRDAALEQLQSVSQSTDLAAVELAKARAEALGLVEMEEYINLENRILLLQKQVPAQVEIDRILGNASLRDVELAISDLLASESSSDIGTVEGRVNPTDLKEIVAIIKADRLTDAGSWLKGFEGYSEKADRVIAIAATEEEARRLLSERRQAAAEELERHLVGTDADALEAALARANQVRFVGKDDLLERTSRRLAALRKQLPYLRDLEKALSGGGTKQLGDVLRSLDVADLRSPENWLPELKVGSLISKVASAFEKGEHETRASRVKDKVARTRRSTISGLSSAHQTGLLLELEEAISLYDAKEIELLLAEASKHGLGMTGVVEKASELLAKLQSANFVRELIDTTTEDAEKHTDDADGDDDDDDEGHRSLVDLRRLANLSDQMQKLRGDSSAIKKARASIVASSRKSCRGSAANPFFFEPSLPARRSPPPVSGAGNSAFDNLLHFTDIKRNSPASLLQHSSKPITCALTQVAQADEVSAIQSFRNILCWMGDLPSCDVKRESSRQAVVRMVRYHPGLVDEIYVQMIKQLTKNSSGRSSAHGWTLFEAICQSMLPSDELLGYTRRFLTQAIKTWSARAAALAQKCFDSLEELDLLPRIAGQLWKYSPSMWRITGWDARYFELRCMHLYWWKSEADWKSSRSSNPTGGKLCNGKISLLADECFVTMSEAHYFTIEPKSGQWTAGSRSTEGTRRATAALCLDDTGATYRREMWVEAIKAHITHAGRIKGRQADTKTVSESFFRPPPRT